MRRELRFVPKGGVAEAPSAGRAWRPRPGAARGRHRTNSALASPASSFRFILRCEQFGRGALGVLDKMQSQPTAAKTQRTKC